MLKYKINILNELKLKGYNTNYMRDKKILGQGTIQQIRTGKVVSVNSLNIICKLLNLQPGDIIEWIPDEE